MDQLIELLKQIQELAGVAIDALSEVSASEGGAPGADEAAGAPPAEGGESRPEGGEPPKDGEKPPFEK